MTARARNPQPTHATPPPLAPPLPDDPRMHDPRPSLVRTRYFLTYKCRTTRILGKLPGHIAFDITPGEQARPQLNSTPNSRLFGHRWTARSQNIPRPQRAASPHRCESWCKTYPPLSSRQHPFENPLLRCLKLLLLLRSPPPSPIDSFSFDWLALLSAPRLLQDAPNQGRNRPHAQTPGRNRDKVEGWKLGRLRGRFRQ